MQLLTFDQRVCVGCKRVETLTETLAVEDTEAFKCAQAEADARNLNSN